MQAWLRKCRIRGLELHDPDHTDSQLYTSLLSSPDMLRNSGDALQSIVDVPFNSQWSPAEFKNLSQVRRGKMWTACSHCTWTIQGQGRVWCEEELLDLILAEPAGEIVGAGTGAWQHSSGPPAQ